MARCATRASVNESFTRSVAMRNRRSVAAPLSRPVTLSAAALLVLAVGCSSDKSTAPQAAPSPQIQAMLSDGFATSTAGFSQTDNSYTANGDQLAGFSPDGWGMSLGLFNRTADLMGGGLGPDFMGAGALFDTEFGEFDAGPFAPRHASSCAFSSTTGRVTCPPQTVGGLTITRSFAYTDSTGKAQQSPNGATNSVNTQVTVTGTILTRDKKDTTTVNGASNRTVTGLVRTATKRTVDGASGATEVTVGRNRQDSTFKTTRTQGDTTTGLVIPVRDRHTSFPTAGSVIRSMKVVVDMAGHPEATSLRREMITYSGTDTAKVVITHDTTSKNCTLPLPHGRLSCS